MSATLYFTRTAWVKPPEGKDLLIFNSCDGYHLATWDGLEFLSNGSSIPIEMAELWIELPDGFDIIEQLRKTAVIGCRSASE